MLGCMAMFQVHSNRGLHAQKWRNSARKQGNKEFSFRVTAVTPCDGLTVTLQLNLAVTSAPDRHHPVTSRPSHPVTPVTGSRESVSPSRNGTNMDHFLFGILNNFYFCFVNLNSSIGHHMSKYYAFLDHKVALFPIKY